MRANAAPMAVGDFCNSLNENKIQINTDYQRNSGLWSSFAKSFFIESIILEYPIPKIFLYSRLDLVSRGTVKEIVDGQQRSAALQQFFNNKLRLSKNVATSELQWKRYSDLDTVSQGKFLGTLFRLTSSPA